MKQRILKIAERLKQIYLHRKKKIYIILTVLFSLILLADLAVVVFMPSQTMNFGGNSEMSGYPQMSEDGEVMMPNMGEFGGGERPDMSESEDGEMTMPEGMEERNFGGETKPGLLQSIKSHWLVIFIIFTVLDAGSIFMLVRICRKEKKQNLLETKEMVQTGLSTLQAVKSKKEGKGRKLSNSRIARIIVVAGMLILVIVIKVLTAQTEETAQTEATVYTETAETGEISSEVPGTGTLTDETAVELELPADVEITQWYVSNGDSVEAGDKLAQVDISSVMAAIVNVQEKLTSLDDALAEHENEEISDTITAATGGKVKVIYASTGADVVETMYEKESLMLISLDGLMAVSIETEADISAGDTVVVTLSDDTELSGKVQSMVNGTAVITVSDEKTDYGEKVTVTTEKGKEVGSGKLYINSELKVTGFTGTVASVNVSVDEDVASGETLLTLTDTDYTGEYETLLSQRSKLETQMQELVELSQDNNVYADCAGVISGLETDTQSGSEQYTSYNTNTNENVVSFTITTPATSDSEIQNEDSSSEGKEESETEDSTGAENEAGTNDTSDAGSGTEDNTDTNAGNANCTDSDANTEDNTNPESGDSADTESVSYINYIGTVTAVQTNPVGNVNITLQTSSGTETYQLTVPSDFYVYTFSGNSYLSGSASQIAVNDMLMLIFEKGNENVTPVLCIRIMQQSMTGEDSGNQNIKQNQIEQMQQTQQSSEMTGTISTGAMSDTTAVMTQAVTEMLEEEVEENYGVTTTTWLSVTPQEKMEITISVDEMDILSLETGMSALVTVDAFPGQSFEGEVTSINWNGENSGGNSKYKVVVSIPREENMLAGMNASVSITLETKDNVLVIPTAALFEDEDGVYVYTSYNEKTKNFGDAVEVTTGISDGENVEILSGLTEGDEYCYSYLDVLNYSTYSSSGSGFSIQSMFGGGRGR